MLTKATLDDLSSHGCAVDGRVEPVLYLHSRCHLDAPYFMLKQDKTIRGLCVLPECAKIVFEIEPWAENIVEKGGFGKFGTFYQGCHPDSAVWVSYERDSGILEVSCYECKQKVADFHI